MKTFKESLALGEDFEVNHAQVFLQQFMPNYYLIPTHNFQTKTGYAGGPRILDGIQTVVMPDFLLIDKTNPANKILVEAKWKKNVFHLPCGSQAFAIEEHRCLDYEKAAAIFGAGLFYLIGCEHTRTIHVYAPDQYLPHTFCNKFTYFKQVNNRCFINTAESVSGKY